MLTCGHEPSPHSECTTGYARNGKGETFCYACVAEMDRQTMIETGSSATLPLYLSKDTVSNWPGSLTFKVTHCRKGKHNIAGVRYDVWFTGPDSKPWHGVQYGDFTQILHARRIKH